MTYLKTLLAAAILATSSSMAGAEGGSTLTVTGTGTISAAPDQAVFRFDVVTADKRADAAMKVNSQNMASAMAILDEQDIPAANIKTTGITLSPVIDHSGTRNEVGELRITGYKASNSVEVTLDDIDIMGPLLTELIAAGVNRIGKIEHGIADTTALRRDARRSAMKNAMDKSRTYADAAGIEIIGVMSIEDGDRQGGRPQPLARTQSMSRGAATPIAAGMTSVTETVHVVFDVSPD